MNNSDSFITRFSRLWNPLILVLVFFIVFIVALFPQPWHRVMYSASFTLLLFSSVITIRKHLTRYLWLALIAVIMEWISVIFGLPVLKTISGMLNFLFFAFITYFYIYQIAIAKTVNTNVILHAVNGYLLLGLVFSILVSMILQLNPGMFGFPEVADAGNAFYFSRYLYFGFVTLSTLGYGDVVPLLPTARSLSILISVSGQLYLAIIIALLVGKYASRKE